MATKIPSHLLIVVGGGNQVTILVNFLVNFLVDLLVGVTSGSSLNNLLQLDVEAGPLLLHGSHSLAGIIGDGSPIDL